MKSIYPNGHDVSTNDLQFTEESREYEDRQRSLSICGDQYGVIEGFVVTDTSTTTNKFEVSVGLAFDEFGYRLNLASGVVVSGITAGDVGSYVVAHVDNSDILPTSHRVTGASEYTREVDGVSISIVSDPASGQGYIKLAYIESFSPGPAASITFSDTVRNSREEFRINPDILGTGSDVSEHRLSAHTDGISGGSGVSLTPSIFDAATDYIEFMDVAADEWISINGILLGANEVNPPSDVSFDTVTDASGSWNVYINSSGNTGKTQSALDESQFLIATVDFDNGDGDLSNLLDLRIFYETTQDQVRVDLVEGETNDSLTAKSTLGNNLNRIRYRLNSIEGIGKAYNVIANSGGDYNGATDEVFNTAINDLPVSGGTLVLADGEWDFSSAVEVNKPVQFVGCKNSVINIIDINAFNISSDDVGFHGIKIVADNTTSGVTDSWGVASILHNNNINVENCIMEFADTSGLGFNGGLLTIAGGYNISVVDNYIESDSYTPYFVKVADSPGYILENLNITNNTGLGVGDGGVSILNFDSGSITNLNIKGNNVTEMGAGSVTYGWIKINDGVNIINTIISKNNLYSAGEGSSLIGNIHIGTVLTSNGGVISDNVIISNAGYGLYITDTNNDWIINGNIFESDYGLLLYISKGIINNNVVKGVVATRNGINLFGGDKNNLIGNIIEGAGAAGIVVNGDDNIIDNNQIDTNFTAAVTDTGADNWATTAANNTSNKVV